MIGSTVHVALRRRNISQKYVAFDCVLIPAKHRPDGLRQFGLASLIDTACVDPEVVNAIFSSLFCAKFEFGISNLVSCYSPPNIVKRHFLVVGAPSMGEDGVERYDMRIVIIQIVREAEVILRIRVEEAEKAHVWAVGIGSPITPQLERSKHPYTVTKVVTRCEKKTQQL